jgi:uncharacterized protein YpiB (UPF0302 family)
LKVVAATITLTTPPIPTTKETQETQSQEKSIAFNIKQQRTIFIELNLKEGKKNVMYVNDGHVIAVVSI